MSEELVRKLLQTFVDDVVAQKLNGIADQARNRIKKMNLTKEEEATVAFLTLEVVRSAANSYFEEAKLRLLNTRI